ncbi:unnamed protein product, partial [Prorocentrum cordatum]
MIDYVLRPAGSRRERGRDHRDPIAGLRCAGHDRRSGPRGAQKEKKRRDENEDEGNVIITLGAGAPQHRTPPGPLQARRREETTPRARTGDAQGAVAGATALEQRAHCMSRERHSPH